MNHEGHEDREVLHQAFFVLFVHFVVKRKEQ